MSDLNIILLLPPPVIFYLRGCGGAEDIMEALAERVPRLGVELGAVGEHKVLQAGDAGPGQLLVVLLDAPLQLGKQVVEQEGGHHGKVLGEHVREGV